jgi:hypothetical protein
MRARAKRSLPGLKAELRSKRKALWLSPPEFPPCLPFVILFWALFLRIMMFNVMAPDPPDFVDFTTLIATGLSVLDLWRIIGVLFGLYLVLNLILFFREQPERKFVGRVCIAAACLCAIGLQVLLYRIGKLPEAWAAERRVPLLIQEMKDPRCDPWGRLNMLSWYGPRARAAIPQIIAVLEGDKRNMARRDAAFTLACVDPEGILAVPALARSLANDPNIQVRLTAVEALLTVLKEPAVPPVVEALLKDKDAAVRAKAARMLGHLGRLARPALPALRQALDDKEIQEDVRKALETISPGGP